MITIGGSAHGVELAVWWLLIAGVLALTVWVVLAPVRRRHAAHRVAASLRQPRRPADRDPASTRPPPVTTPRTTPQDGARP